MRYFAENGFFERWAGFYTKSNNADVKLMKFKQYIGKKLFDS